MSKSLIGEQLSAEMSEVQKAGAVPTRPATFRQLTEVLLDDSNELEIDSSDYRAIPDIVETSSGESQSRRIIARRKPRLPNPKKKILSPKKSKPRFGLPEGFRPRLQQYGRSLLLEDNIYALSGGQEFIPRYPTGTLGRLSHMYALLTVEQFVQDRRGSVYVRSDGRIFDYSVDHADPSRDMFDTGYTIYDLKRTGRYAPKDKLEKKQKEDLKPRKLAHAG